MCGIAGGSLTTFERAHLYMMASLGMETQVRGRDGFGFYARSRSGVEVYYREPSPDFDELITLMEPLVGETDVLIVMTSRAQPLPEAETTQERLQPYVGDRFALVHNGTISNDRDLWARMADEDEVHPGVDTMVVHQWMELHGEVPTDELVGGWAFGVIDKSTHTLRLLKNTKTLWLSRWDYGTVFASEPEMLERTFRARPLGNPSLEALPPWHEWSSEEPDRGAMEIPGERLRWGSTPDLDDRKAVIVTSGGIDSITAAYVAAKVHGRTPTLVTFPHGQLAEGPEVAAVRVIAEREGWDHRVVDLRWMGKLGSSPLTDASIELPLGMRSAESTLCWTPGRNMVMVSAAAAIAEAIGAEWLYYGNNMEEEATAYGDNDLDFVHYFDRLLQYGTLKGVRITRALARLMKPEILVLADHLGVPLDLTWSCDLGRTDGLGVAFLGGTEAELARHAFMACGECGCCTTRRYAFKRAGLPDPQNYALPLRDVYPWEGAKDYDIEELLDLVRYHSMV